MVQSIAKTSMQRRLVLRSIGGLALAGTARGARAASGEPDFAVPAGACDCHAHIYDPRFAYAPNARLRPAHASVADYRREVQSRVRTSRAIFVTPSTYGTDNRCLTDALAQLAGAARGVAVVSAEVDLAALRQLHAAGVRGVRVNLPKDQLIALSTRLHDMGWHLELFVPGERLVEMEATLLSLPVPIVLDHLAHLPEPDATRSEGFKTVRRLLDTGRCWIKCSGAYIDSRIGPPDYPDSSQLAKAYIAVAPERCLWASNWPFPDISAGAKQVPRPDVLPFMNLFDAWVPDANRRRQILVTNPENLYGFETN
jgi:predicted TIM-barrel fold metal-dependent hydrolase